MKNETITSTVLEKIRDLETELAAQWRLLGAHDVAAMRPDFHVLEMQVEDISCLVAVDSVREVVGMVWPQPLADAPPWVLGTFVFEEQTVPLVDLRQRLVGKKVAPSPRERIVIVDRPRWLGLMVDSVGRVVEVAGSELQTAGPEIPHADFLIGIIPREDGATVHLLSPERLGRELDGGHQVR